MKMKSNAILAIVIATHNRLPFLKKTIISIEKQTTVPYQIIVVDGGSVDGTKKFLQSRKDIVSVFQAKRVGTAKAFNAGWKSLKEHYRYTCWLSDDTQIVSNILDKAVGILEKNPDIGMVGLKMKDTKGVFDYHPYLGSVSCFGILNCNHGLLRLDLLQKVGYFNEAYRSYTIDPDLTASVLSTGKKVVLTKEVGILHNRKWAHKSNLSRIIQKEKKGIDNEGIYRRKFSFLNANNRNILPMVSEMAYSFLVKFISGWFGIISFIRDLRNIFHSKYIHKLDLLNNFHNEYYLVQEIPKDLLNVKGNPYRKYLYK